MHKVAFFLFTIPLLVSCSKNDSGNNAIKYYLKFRANGVLTEYPNASVLFYNEANCMIAGAANDSIGNAMMIDLQTNSKIQANNSYIETEKVPAPFNYLPKCYFRHKFNTQRVYNYASWQTISGTTYIYDCTVNVLELDQNHMKGNFSGKVKSETDNTFIIITQGEFNVKR